MIFRNSFTMNRWKTLYALLVPPCFITLICFSKMPVVLFMGSMWGSICFFMFILIFAPAMCFLQFSHDTDARCGMLLLFHRNMALLDVGAYATMINNLMRLTMNNAHLTVTIGYFIFSLYECTGEHCSSSRFIWGSCLDKWSVGDCKEDYDMVIIGPTAEEKFMVNYVLMRSESINPPRGFPEWFGIEAYVCGLHFITLLLILLLCYPGKKIFIYLLYVLSPLAVITLIVTVAYVGTIYSNASGQLNTFLNKFFMKPATIVPLDRYSRDQYRVKPLVWGFLVMFVQLSQASQLWNGIFPVIGKWVGGKGMKRHSSWVIILLGWALLLPLPVLLMVFATASAYDMSYLRCHLGSDWLSPFVIIPHVFSKFSSHRALAACFFVSLALFLLLHQCLLLMTTTSTIMEMITPDTTPHKQKKTRSRIARMLTCIFVLLLGLPLLQRTGFYWMRLLDAYLDRLLVVTMLFQSIGYLVIYLRQRRRSLHSTFFLAVFYGVLICFAAMIYLWYAVTIFTKPALDSQCPTYLQAPENDPVRNEYQVIGWCIALFPILVGILITILTVWRSAERHNLSMWKIMLFGVTGAQRGPRNGYHVAVKTKSPSELGLYHLAMADL